MRKYKYTATDKNGKTVKGNFVAESEIEMKQMLAKSGLFVLSVREISSKDFSSFFSISGKIKVSEMKQFCNQFSVMISSGISIVEAIEVSMSQSYSNLLRKTLMKVNDDLKQGLLLSEAMAKYPRIFPAFFSSMVFVGESAGCLDRVLVTVADYYDLEDRTKKKVRGALAYPIILLVMLVGVVAVMMGFVIPTFISSLKKMDVEMPFITMAVFNASNFFVDNWQITLGFTAAIVIVFWLLNWVPSVRKFYDRMKVTLPVFRKINMALFTSRFARSLGLLLSSGSDTLSALESIKKIIDNRFLYDQFQKVINNVRAGMSLSASLEMEMQLSPILIQMVIVGERTGELDKVLVSTAPYFDAQAEASLNLITTIVQPAVLVTLGVVVAILFVAMYSPILSMITDISATSTGGTY